MTVLWEFGGQIGDFCTILNKLTRNFFSLKVFCEETKRRGFGLVFCSGMSPAAMLGNQARVYPMLDKYPTTEP